MARKPRIHLENVTQHVIQRGANRDLCFFAEQDYRFYLECLGDALKRYRCECHAYVLMTNHVHLLLTPRADSAIAQVMKLLGQRYTQYVNYTYKRTGTIWEGRYKASVIDAENYLLICYRYIELNPVRAAMVERPSEYKWSSARANGFGVETNMGSDPVGLTPGTAYQSLGSDDKARQKAYRELFRGHLDNELIHELGQIFSQEQILGNSWFKALVEAEINENGEGEGVRPQNVFSGVSPHLYLKVLICILLRNKKQTIQISPAWERLIAFHQPSSKSSK